MYGDARTVEKSPDRCKNPAKAFSPLLGTSDNGAKPRKLPRAAPSPGRGRAKGGAARPSPTEPPPAGPPGPHRAQPPDPGRSPATRRGKKRPTARLLPGPAAALGASSPAAAAAASPHLSALSADSASAAAAAQGKPTPSPGQPGGPAPAARTLEGDAGRRRAEAGTALLSNGAGRRGPYPSAPGRAGAAAPPPEELRPRESPAAARASTRETLRGRKPRRQLRSFVRGSTGSVAGRGEVFLSQQAAIPVTARAPETSVRREGTIIGAPRISGEC